MTQSHFLHDLTKVLVGLVQTLGLLGVFALTLFDGSLLWMIPGINDIALIGFVAAKGTWPWAVLGVLAATMGSLLGALMVYRIAVRGGSGVIARRFPPKLLKTIEQWTGRMGALPVGLAALLPPPCPYAPFVWSAGFMKVPRPHFVISVTLGRGMRYTLDAILAIVIGHKVLIRLHDFYWSALKIAVLVATVVAVIGTMLWLQFRQPTTGAPGSEGERS